MSGRPPRALPPSVAAWVRRHARQHDYSTVKLLPLIAAKFGPTPAGAVRDYLWHLKYAAIEAGENTEPVEWEDAHTLIADLRHGSDDALSQYRDAFG